MRIETALNHERQFKMRASGIFHGARLCASSHRDILDRVGAEIYSADAYKRCPGWVHERVKQCLDNLHARIYQPELSGNQLEKIAASGDASGVPWVRWALRVDGIERTSDWISKRRGAGDEDIWSRVVGAHVWNHKPESVFSEGGWKSTCS